MSAFRTSLIRRASAAVAAAIAAIVSDVNSADGKGKKNLSSNGIDIGDFDPAFSPDGKTIAYASVGVQNSNSEGDWEIFRMNSLDGTAKKNLSNNGLDVFDYYARWGR